MDAGPAHALATQRNNPKSPTCKDFMNIDELSIMIYQFLQQKGDEVPKNLLNERKNEVSAKGLLLLQRACRAWAQGHSGVATR
jgi:hypothetical protein